MGYKKNTEFKTAFDSYTVIEKIGSGGSGEVYKVTDSEGHFFAIKVLDSNRATTSKLKRFRNEINFSYQSRHPNVVQIIGSGIAPDGATFYVMPLYQATLREVIRKGLVSAEIMKIFGRILDGVEAAHLKGVWHRDLKPENILLSSTIDIVVVADFGIAHFEEEELFTAVETKVDDRLANFLYASPEQKIRGRSVDSKADIYALGLILNEMFTKEPALGTGHKKIGDVDAAYRYLDGIIERMLSQEPAKRPSVAEVKLELIARGNEFLRLQRLDSLKSQVIPETELDDPFVKNPIYITGIDYENGYLEFTLSAVPPPNWVMQFQNPPSSRFYLGQGPDRFTFNRNLARVHVTSGAANQQMVDYAKSYVESANKHYAQTVATDNQERIREQREELNRKIKAEDDRQKILSQLKI